MTTYCIYTKGNHVLVHSFAAKTTQDALTEAYEWLEDAEGSTPDHFELARVQSWNGLEVAAYNLAKRRQISC